MSAYKNINIINTVNKYLECCKQFQDTKKQ